jgi:ABC-type transport system substrate-binding protein
MLVTGMNKLIKNKKLIFIIIVAGISVIILNSCIYDDAGLFATLDEESADCSQNSPVVELDKASKEFFLESKEKQMNKNLLNDSNIRKAIFYAIDRDKIVNELFSEYNQVHNSLFPEDSYYYSQSWSEYNYDINKAKEFLDIAGYGVNNPLYITIGSISNSSTKQTIEDIIKEDLSRIGIKIWIFNKSSEEWYSECVGNGEYELGLWSIYNFEGGNLGYSFSSEKIPSMATEENKYCENFYWYNNPEVDGLLKRIGNEEDIDVKRQLYKDVQDMLADDAVVLPLYNRMFYIAYNNKKLQDIDLSVKNNKVFFNLEKWSLYNGEDTPDAGENEVIIGFEGEDYELNNLLKRDYISSLLIKGLWEINEYGEYENILVDEDYNLEYNSPGLSEKKVKVVLKDEIFWEDGMPITSKDIKYTFDLIRENNNLNGVDEEFSKVKEIEVINEKEFNIIFSEYVKNWKKIFNFILLPEGALDEKGMEDFSVKDIVANGPYKVEQYISDEYLLLKKNDLYFNEIPDIDYFKILFDSDINNLIGMLKDSELDLLIVPFDIDLIKGIDEDKNLNLLIKPGNMIEHLAICLKPKED